MKVIKMGLGYVTNVESRDRTMKQRKTESSNTAQAVVSICEIAPGHEERIGIGLYYLLPPQFKWSALILEPELGHVEITQPIVPKSSQHLGFNTTKISP